MRICVWITNHEISQTVGHALADGLNADIRHTSVTDPADYEQIMAYDAHVAYGILRGCDAVFKAATRCGVPFFEVDRGYLNPGHFDGNYRLSLNGTQAIWHEGIPRKPWDGKLEPWRTGGDYVLICPPTEAVCAFFGVAPQAWLNQSIELCKGGAYGIRFKGASQEADWDEISAVITFNSSVGWKALQMGIPVLSDPHHSLIGSHYKTQSLEILTQNLHDLPDTRIEIFEAMEAHQFSLEEIKRGEAWPVLNHYLSKSTSATTPANPSPTQSANIPYGSARLPK